MLLNSHEFASQLLDVIRASRGKIIIFSAFIKLDALIHLCNVAELDNNSEVLVVARWQKKDLLAGASDLKVYEFCRCKGWMFGVSLRMHSKLFSIDDQEIFLGSANLTRKGLSIGLVGNHEFGTRIPAESTDLQKLKNFVESEVQLIDDTLFDAISTDIELGQSEQNEILSASWSNEILKQLIKPVSYIWVNELPKSKPIDILQLKINDPLVASDCELFGIDFDRISEPELVRCFQTSRIYRWLFELVSNSKEVYFGAVTSSLHDALLDDPKPYRVEVKDAVKSLYSWAELCGDTFLVDRPNHSQRITLK